MAIALARPSSALINFESVLEAGEAWINWIDDAERFKSTLENKIPWDQLDKSAIALVQKKLKQKLPSNQLLLNSLYLTMASSFEEFLRSVIQQTATDLLGKSKKYEDLSEAIRNLHLREAAKLLRRLDSLPDYLNVTAIQLSTAIGSCVPGSKSVEINSEILGNIDGLIRLASFFERMESFGKQISFDSLGAESSIAQALKMTGSKARPVAKALESCAFSISKNRNRIAHTGNTAADVSATLLVEHREILRVVARVIAGL